MSETHPLTSGCCDEGFASLVHAVRPEPVLVFDAQGYASLDFGALNEGFREAICPICNEPIRWALDMFSFQVGARPRHLVHARCGWMPSALRAEARRATDRW